MHNNKYQVTKEDLQLWRQLVPNIRRKLIEKKTTYLDLIHNIASCYSFDTKQPDALDNYCQFLDYLTQKDIPVGEIFHNYLMGQYTEIVFWDQQFLQLYLYFHQTYIQTTLTQEFFNTLFPKRNDEISLENVLSLADNGPKILKNAKKILSYIKKYKHSFTYTQQKKIKEYSKNFNLDMSVGYPDLIQKNLFHSTTYFQSHHSFNLNYLSSYFGFEHASLFSETIEDFFNYYNNKNLPFISPDCHVTNLSMEQEDITLNVFLSFNSISNQEKFEIFLNDFLLFLLDYSLNSNTIDYDKLISSFLLKNKMERDLHIKNTKKIITKI